MLTKLRFYANAQALAYIPGSRAGIGQPAHYIGRRYVAPKDGGPSSYPATPEPHEVQLDRAKLTDEQLFLRYMKLTQRGDILAADEATAKECGVEYRAAVFNDDEWTLPPAPTLVGSEHASVVTAPSEAGTLAAPSASTVSARSEKRFNRKESE